MLWSRREMKIPADCATRDRVQDLRTYVVTKPRLHEVLRLSYGRAAKLRAATRAGEGWRSRIATRGFLGVVIQKL